MRDADFFTSNLTWPPIVTPGVELAFLGRRRIELSGRTPSGAFATRTIPVCGPGAFTVLKALAFGNRAENKDACDLFYVVASETPKSWRA